MLSIWPNLAGENLFQYHEITTALKTPSWPTAAAQALREAGFGMHARRKSTLSPGSFGGLQIQKLPPVPQMLTQPSRIRFIYCLLKDFG